jgi:large subunit ribosomal protein L24
VVIIAGKDKGKRGKILSFKGFDRAYVSGANLIKKHVKPNPQKNVKGGIEEKESPIHLSNLALFNPETQKGDKVAFVFNGDGKKIRVFRSNKKPTDVI